MSSKTTRNTENKNINFWLLFIGVVLLFIHSMLEINVISELGDTSHPAIIWIVTMISKSISSISIALVVGGITSYIRTYQENHDVLTDERAQMLLEKIVSNKDPLLSEYKTKRGFAIYDLNSNCRTNVNYTVTAYIENGKVKAKTVLSFTEHKSSGAYGRISNYSDSDNMVIESIKISNPADTNDYEEFKGTSISEEKSTAFSEDFKFERFITTPERFNRFESLSIQKVFIIEGEDHWLNYALLFQKPSKGVNFSLTTMDGLVIKEVVIFGDDKSYSKIQNNSSLQIKSNNWISNNNGFSVIIAKEEDETEKQNQEKKK